MMTEHVRIENGAIAETFSYLPERITLPTGQTITGFNTLPVAVLASLGYLPVFRDMYNPETHYLHALPEIGASAVLYHALPRDIAELKEQARQKIDLEAGSARQRHVPPFSLLTEEYRQAEKEAAEFKAAGYPAFAIPPSIVASMAAKGLDAQTEAESILAEAALLTGLLATIRGVRLTGKANVDAAVDNDAVIAARDAALAQLAAL